MPLNKITPESYNNNIIEKKIFDPKLILKKKNCPISTRSSQKTLVIFEELEEKYSSRCRNLTRWTYDLNKISINASREAERVTALKSNRSPALLASCSI